MELLDALTFHSNRMIKAWDEEQNINLMPPIDDKYLQKRLRTVLQEENFDILNYPNIYTV